MAAGIRAASAAVAALVTLAALAATALPNPAAFPVFRDGRDGGGTNWAVLVAGSNGWYGGRAGALPALVWHLTRGARRRFNYRHQSDVYHAYQILKRNGYPDSNIIVFHYDDIAANPANKRPGVVINHPNGADVYAGVPKNYTKSQVTPANFLAVLKGDAAAASGPVLHSGPNDHVFVNFVDHGATSLVAFPTSYLYAKDLIAALQYMSQHQLYGELVFYLEACESGSMFQGLLPPGIKIYATTASSATQSSYACYYDAQLGTYLGDLYSVNWMENTDAVDVRTETLQTQFTIVRNLTKLSIVMQYGDLSMQSEPIGAFLGFELAHAARAPPPPSHASAPLDAIDARDVKLDVLTRQVAQLQMLGDSTALLQAQAALASEQAYRAHVTRSIRAVAEQLLGTSGADRVLGGRPGVVTEWDCYRGAVDAYEQRCGRFGDFGLKYAYVLANLCQARVSVDAIDAAALSVCGRS